MISKYFSIKGKIIKNVEEQFDFEGTKYVKLDKR